MMLKISIVALCISVIPAFGQVLEPELKFELPICVAQFEFSSKDGRKGWAFATQYAAQAADLQKKLAEAEAKIAELQRGVPPPDQNQ